MKQLLLLAVLAASIGHADDNSINLNGVQLTIGMTKSIVLTRLRSSSNLEDHSSPSRGIDVWFVRSKSDANTEDTVQFADDKLVAVDVERTSAKGEDAAMLINRLFLTLRELEQSGKNIAVRTRPEDEFQPSPRLRFRQISFVAGQREFRLQVSEPIGASVGRTSTVSFHEMLFAPPPKPVPGAKEW
jgi:hypothetical protein